MGCTNYKKIIYTSTKKFRWYFIWEVLFIIFGSRHGLLDQLIKKNKDKNREKVIKSSLLMKVNRRIRTRKVKIRIILLK